MTKTTDSPESAELSQLASNGHVPHKTLQQLGFITHTERPLTRSMPRPFCFCHVVHCMDAMETLVSNTAMANCSTNRVHWPLGNCDKVRHEPTTCVPTVNMFTAWLCASPTHFTALGLAIHSWTNMTSTDLKSRPVRCPAAVTPFAGVLHSVHHRLLPVRCGTPVKQGLLAVLLRHRALPTLLKEHAATSPGGLVSNVSFESFVDAFHLLHNLCKVDSLCSGKLQ